MHNVRGAVGWCERMTDGQTGSACIMCREQWDGVRG